MRVTMAKVRRIGNSRGILLSKAMLEESGIKDTVTITVKDNLILISPTPEKRKKKWSDFKRSRKETVPFVVNRFDSTDWTWE